MSACWICSVDKVTDVESYLQFAETQLDEYLLLTKDLSTMRERIAAVQAGREQMSATRLAALEGSLQSCDSEAQERGPRVVRRLNWVCTQADYSVEENTQKIADLEAKLRTMRLKVSQMSALKSKAKELLAKYGAAGVKDEQEGLRASTESVKFHRVSSMLHETDLINPVQELRGTVVLDRTLDDDLDRVGQEVDEAFEKSWRSIR